MSDEKTDKPEPKKIPTPTSHPAFMCDECGNFYNRYDYKCPRCTLRADIMAKLDLVLAAGDMKGGEKKPAKKTGK